VCRAWLQRRSQVVRSVQLHNSQLNAIGSTETTAAQHEKNTTTQASAAVMFEKQAQPDLLDNRISAPSQPGSSAPKVCGSTQRNMTVR
jgi:hypothetical protein